MAIKGRVLKTPQQICLLLSHTLRKLELSGDIGQLDRAKVIINGCSTLAAILRDSNTELRIAKIEKALEDLTTQTQAPSQIKLLPNQSILDKEVKLN